MKELKVVFMGTPEFAVPILKALIEHTNVVLVVSQADSPVGRKRIMTPSPVKQLALSNNIEVFTPHKLRDEYEVILNKKPDIVITCAYGQIVPKAILDYPEYGCINVHASLLPKYRGANPIVAAIQNGDDKTGITLMYMEEGVDTGNIIQAREEDILKTDTLGSLSKRLSELGAKTLIDTLPSIIECENFDIPQDHEVATMTKKLKRADEFIDFSKNRQEIYDFVRSLNPEPFACAKILGEEWKFIEVSIGESKNAQIGVICSVSKDSFSIGCADGLIVVTKVKLPGKKEMTVKELFNGYNKEKLLNVKVGE